MKNLKVLTQTLLLLFLFTATHAQITGTFTADNCYSVYVGTQSSVGTKVLPTSGNGHCNKKASEIFSPTSNSFSATSANYFYIIAWSDDMTCQGLMGEFTGNRTIKTGDPGWEVYPTNKNYGNGQAPSASEINSQISTANSSSGWRAPFVGPTNTNGKKACRAYSKVKGISNDAKWIWHNTTNSSDPLQVLGKGKNHHEFLIFRFPVKTIIGGGHPSTPHFDPCCPPIAKEDLSNMLSVSGNMQTYKPNFTFTKEFTNRMRAYSNYIMALDPCLDNVTLEYVIRRPYSLPNSFNLAGNTLLSRGATYFKRGLGKPLTWGQGHLSDITLETNKWYRLEIVAYGGGDDCKNWNIGEGCDFPKLEFNIMTEGIRNGDVAKSGRLNGTIKSVGATLR